MTKTEIWVCNILTPLLKEVDKDSLLLLNEKTVLTGQGGALDSLLLIRFISDLEMCIQNHLNDSRFTLLTLDLINHNETIFKTIHSCSEYIHKLFESKMAPL